MELKMILKGEYLCGNAAIPDKNTLVAQGSLSKTNLAFFPGRAKDLSHV